MKKLKQINAEQNSLTEKYSAKKDDYECDKPIFGPNTN